MPHPRHRRIKAGWCPDCEIDLAGLAIEDLYIAVGTAHQSLQDLGIVRCPQCGRMIVCEAGEPAWPPTPIVRPAPDSLPEILRQHYAEAVMVFPSSPRCSLALLQLGIGTWCVDAASGSSLPDGIEMLVQQCQGGPSPALVQALVSQLTRPGSPAPLGLIAPLSQAHNAGHEAMALFGTLRELAMPSHPDAPPP